MDASSDVCSFQLPNFVPLEVLIIKKSPLILVASELTDGGTRVRLIPVHVGSEKRENIFVQDSLPTLDLAIAGIDLKRSPAEIIEDVNNFLENQTFLAVPDFSFVRVAGLISPTASGDLFDLLVSLAVLKRIQASFRLINMHEIPGLEASQNIRGTSIITLLKFLAFEALAADTTLNTTFFIAAEFCAAQEASEHDWREYAELGFFTRRRTHQKLVDRDALVVERIKKFEVLLKCILDGTDPTEALEAFKPPGPSIVAAKSWTG